MNIILQIDETHLNAVVGDIVSFDEDGDAVVEGQKRVADMIAEQIAARVASTEEFRELRKKVTAIRDEMIREKLEPVLAEAMSTPIQKTNWMGEPTGDVMTMRELIVDAARDVVSKPDRSGRNQASWVQNFIYDEVRKMFEKELKQELADAKAKLTQEITGRTANFFTGVLAKPLADAE